MRNRDIQILVDHIDGRKVAGEALTGADVTLLKLWDEIVSGGISAGATITPDYLVTLLEAAPVLVQEILIKFEFMGMLKCNHDGTVQVLPLTITELERLCDAIVELEGILTAHLATDIRDGAVPIIGRLSDIQRRVRRTVPIRDAKLSEQLNIDFKREIKALCHSSYLISIHDYLMVLLERYRCICRGAERAISLVVSELEVVIDRIWAGDVDGARDAMREHTLLMCQHYMEYLSRHPNFQQQSVAAATAERHI
jgi:DNA-binding GntR family transcriptional regulator